MLPVLHVSTNVSSERRSKPRDDLMAPAKPCPASIPPASTAYSRKLYLYLVLKCFLGCAPVAPHKNPCGRHEFQRIFRRLDNRLVSCRRRTMIWTKISFALAGSSRCFTFRFFGSEAERMHALMRRSPAQRNSRQDATLQRQPSKRRAFNLHEVARLRGSRSGGSGCRGARHSL